MTTPIDLGAEVDAICKKLGVDKDRAFAVSIFPTRASVRLYEVDDGGNIRVENGEPLWWTEDFEVSLYAPSPPEEGRKRPR